MGQKTYPVGNRLKIIRTWDSRWFARKKSVFADNLVGCGGGPAANAAIAVSRLGYKAAFAGYLGQDLYGEMHHQELMDHHVNTQLVVRDSSPTPLSTVLVKPDGKRALINYKGSTFFATN